MKIELRNAALVGAATLLVAGCAAMGETPRAMRDCETEGGNRTCNIAITPHPSGAYSCDLGRFNIDPDYVRLLGRRPVKIVWTVDRPYAFCDGDRPFLKGVFVGGDEIWESFGSDDASGSRKGGERAGACRSSWSWTWSNGAADREHRYGITFRDATSGRTCTIDPWIKNGR